MTIVADASVVVAALIDGGPDGAWAERLIASEPLLAPHLMLMEAGNILRRASIGREVSDDIASLAYGDLLDLTVELLPFEPFAGRIWELRQTVTVYDAWYVAIAERFTLPLATLDGRLANAPGVRCAFHMPLAR